MLKPEIKIGSPIRFERKGNEPEVQEMLDRWRNIYGDDVPFRVNQRLGDHISVFIEGQEDRLIHFGSTGISLVHVGFFRLRLP